MANGMFYQNAQQALRQSDEERALRLAELGATGMGPTYYSALAGASMGRALGGLFGLEDPRLTQARQMEEQMQGIDLNDPKGVYSLSSQLMQMGDFDRALQLYKIGTEMEQNRLTASTSGGMKEWQFKHLQKVQTVQNRAREMAYELTPSQVSDIAAQAKDEVFVTPEGREVSTIDMLIMRIGSRIPGAPAVKSEAVAGIPQPESYGIYPTPESLRIDAIKETERQQKAAAEQRAEEQLALQKRSEQRAIDESKKQDTRWVQQRQEALSKEITDNGISEMEASLKEVEKLFDKYKNRNIPGVNWIEQLAADSESKEVKQAFSALRNSVLKKRSGAAVTQPEFERLKEEVQGFYVPTDEAAINWVGSLRRQLELMKGNIFAGYGSDIKEQFWNAGGVMPMQMSQGMAALQSPLYNQVQTAKEAGYSDEQIRDFLKKQGKTDQEINTALGQ